MIDRKALKSEADDLCRSIPKEIKIDVLDPIDHWESTLCALRVEGPAGCVDTAKGEKHFRGKRLLDERSISKIEGMNKMAYVMQK